ncbi:MAG: hypothetical protein Q8N94_08860, partial [Methanoregula sp.]|nr:hypothetical protein [Methanoregula sp.]
DVPPPQGFSEAQRGKKVSTFQSLKPPRGRPFGGGGIHPILGYGGISHPLCNLLNSCIYPFKTAINEILKKSDIDLYMETTDSHAAKTLISRL